MKIGVKGMKGHMGGGKKGQFTMGIFSQKTLYAIDYYSDR